MNVAAVARGLPERYASRVGADDLAGMRSMAGAGEWAELVDLLIASLALSQTPVTTAERDELATLVDALRLEPSESLERLRVRSAG